MKAQHRHELETNALAKKLHVWGEKLSPYSSWITGALAAMVILYVALTQWNARGARREAAAWDEFQAALFAGDLEYDGVRRVAGSDEFSGSRMQEWALLTWADRQLYLAAQSYLIDREAARERLTDITGIYEQLAEAGSNDQLRNRARLGLARVSEMQNRLDDARSQYAAVEGVLSGVARARLQKLETDEAAEICEWLATAELYKPTPPTGSGMPGSRPGFDATPPETEGGAEGFDPGRTLEEILGGVGDEGDRYPDSGEAAPGGETADETGASDGSSSESESSGESAADDAPPADVEQSSGQQ